MDKLMDNANLWHLRNQIFEDLSHEDVLKCRRVCKYWNESLRRLSDVKFIQEFGERDVEFTKVSTIFEEPMPIWPNQCEEDEPDPENKVSSIFPGWKKAAQNYGVQASIKELEEVKNSLKKLARGKGKICSDPVHEAARNGDVKLIEFIIKTSFDMNTKDSRYGWTALQVACTNGKTETVQLIIQNSKDFGIDLNAKDNRGNTAWHYACQYGRTEIAQLIIQYSKDFGIDLNAATAWLSACYEGHTETAELIIQNSKDFGIDLNAKDEDGSTALHWACWNGRTETVQMILKNWKEFGINIKLQNNRGQTALDHVNHSCFGNLVIKRMLESEYFQIDVTESVKNLD